MADKVQERLLTADDLLAMPDDGTKRYALIEGQLITMSPTGLDHGLLTSEINALLKAFSKPRGLGKVYGAETGFRVKKNPDTVYGIDVAFVTTARVQTGSKYFEGAPDLAVEVMSDSNRAGEMRKKYTACFKAGCKLFWIVYPKSRRIRVYRPDGTEQILHLGDTLEGYDVLSGLALPVATVFDV